MINRFKLNCIHDKEVQQNLLVMISKIPSLSIEEIKDEIQFYEQLKEYEQHIPYVLAYRFYIDELVDELAKRS